MANCNDRGSMPGSYSGYPGSNLWNNDSRPLGTGTDMLRSFVVQNIVQDNIWEIDRVTRYYLFWKFYDGNHYKDFNDGMLSFNYIRAFIDKVIMFLLGDSGFSFHVKSYYSDQVDKELEKVAEEFLMYHWNKSGKVQTAYELFQMGSITGDAWLGLEWMDGIGEKYCKVRVYDSRQCFPIFRGGNKNDVESFMVRQQLELTTMQRNRLFVTRYTKETIETWYQEDVSIDPNKIVKKDFMEYKNPYGFIPVVHIKNRPNSEDFYGKSDANDILKLNKVYNELMQQLKSVIDYHATPVTVITGGNATNLKKGPGQLWSGLPAEANVYNLGLDVDLSATVDFIKDIKTAMHELSDVPENALGKIQAISNTSGTALQITYHPLIQQANLKAVTYGDGITKVNSMIFAMTKIMDPENSRLKQINKMEKNFLTDMMAIPIFAYGFPKDRLDELTKAQMELQLGIASKREIMERLGKSNISELLTEIDDDKLNDGFLQAKLSEMMMSESDDSENEDGETGSGMPQGVTEKVLTGK